MPFIESHYNIKSLLQPARLQIGNGRPLAVRLGQEQSGARRHTPQAAVNLTIAAILGEWGGSSLGLG